MALLYIDLSIVLIEEVHWIYKILCCSGSFRVTAPDTRFPALLSLISEVQDPLHEHNWLCNSWPFSCLVLSCWQQNVNCTQCFHLSAASTAWALQKGDSQRTEGWHKLIRENVHKSMRDSTEASLTSLAILWYYEHTTWSTVSLPVQYINQQFASERCFTEI